MRRFVGALVCLGGLLIGGLFGLCAAMWSKPAGADPLAATFFWLSLIPALVGLACAGAGVWLMFKRTGKGGHS